MYKTRTRGFFSETMKKNSKPLILCLIGAVWPLLVIPFMMLNHLNYAVLSKAALPAIFIWIFLIYSLMDFFDATFCRRR